MDNEKNIFSLIVKNSIFAFLKEKYNDYKIDDSKDDDNINQIFNLLLELEKYSHIPDKKNIIKEHYYLMKSFMINGNFKEEEFLTSLKDETQDLTLDEKNYILNSVIFITNEDNNISNIEKEIILEISRFLGINSSYNDILLKYKKSEFNKEKILLNKIIVIGIGILLVIIIGIFITSQNISKAKLFETNNYQFDEITFNKYIIYKNEFKISSDKFKKYAIYYMNGTAKISFNPKNIDYNSITKTITLNQDNFKVELYVSPKNEKEIDKVNPKNITSSEAKTLGVVVGIAGAYTGGKIASKITGLLPLGNQFLSGTIGAIVGAGTGYFATTKALENVKFSSDISEKEKDESFKIGKKLIQLQLERDDKLIQMYKEHFEIFIKAKYKTMNKDVQNIEYKKLNNGNKK